MEYLEKKNKLKLFFATFLILMTSLVTSADKGKVTQTQIDSSQVNVKELVRPALDGVMEIYFQARKNVPKWRSSYMDEYYQFIRDNNLSHHYVNLRDYDDTYKQLSRNPKLKRLIDQQRTLFNSSQEKMMREGKSSTIGKSEDQLVQMALDGNWFAFQAYQEKAFEPVISIVERASTSNQDPLGRAELIASVYKEAENYFRKRKVKTSDGERQLRFNDLDTTALGSDNLDMSFESFREQYNLMLPEATITRMNKLVDDLIADSSAGLGDRYASAASRLNSASGEFNAADKEFASLLEQMKQEGEKDRELTEEETLRIVKAYSKAQLSRQQLIEAYKNIQALPNAGAGFALIAEQNAGFSFKGSSLERFLRLRKDDLPLDQYDEFFNGGTYERDLLKEVQAEMANIGSEALKDCSGVECFVKAAKIASERPEFKRKLEALNALSSHREGTPLTLLLQKGFYDSLASRHQNDLPTNLQHETKKMNLLFDITSKLHELKNINDTPNAATESDFTKSSRTSREIMNALRIWSNEHPDDDRIKDLLVEAYLETFKKAASAQGRARNHLLSTLEVLRSTIKARSDIDVNRLSNSLRGHLENYLSELSHAEDPIGALYSHDFPCNRFQSTRRQQCENAKLARSEIDKNGFDFLKSHNSDFDNGDKSEGRSNFQAYMKKGYDCGQRSNSSEYSRYINLPNISSCNTTQPIARGSTESVSLFHNMGLSIQGSQVETKLGVQTVNNMRDILTAVEIDKDDMEAGEGEDLKEEMNDNPALKEIINLQDEYLEEFRDHLYLSKIRESFGSALFTSNGSLPINSPSSCKALEEDDQQQIETLQAAVDKIRSDGIVPQGYGALSGKTIDKMKEENLIDGLVQSFAAGFIHEEMGLPPTSKKRLNTEQNFIELYQTNPELYQTDSRGQNYYMHMYSLLKQEAGLGNAEQKGYFTTNQKGPGGHEGVEIHPSIKNHPFIRGVVGVDPNLGGLVYGNKAFHIDVDKAALRKFIKSRPDLLKAAAQYQQAAHHAQLEKTRNDLNKICKMPLRKVYTDDEDTETISGLRTRGTLASFFSDPKNLKYLEYECSLRSIEPITPWWEVALTVAGYIALGIVTGGTTLAAAVIGASVGIAHTAVQTAHDVAITNGRIAELNLAYDMGFGTKEEIEAQEKSRDMQIGIAGGLVGLDIALAPFGIKASHTFEKSILGKTLKRFSRAGLTRISNYDNQLSHAALNSVTRLTGRARRAAFQTAREVGGYDPNGVFHFALDSHGVFQGMRRKSGKVIITRNIDKLDDLALQHVASIPNAKYAGLTKEAFKELSRKKRKAVLAAFKARMKSKFVQSHLQELQSQYAKLLAETTDPAEREIIQMALKGIDELPSLMRANDALALTTGFEKLTAKAATESVEDRAAANGAKNLIIEVFAAGDDSVRATLLKESDHLAEVMPYVMKDDELLATVAKRMKEFADQPTLHQGATRRFWATLARAARECVTPGAHSAR